MQINIYEDKRETSIKAANKAAKILKSEIAKKGKVNFVAATGASQFAFLKSLTNKEEINWSKAEMFHLDEYIGISEKHPASFRKYLKERLTSKVDIDKVNFIKGDAEKPELECQRLNELIGDKTIDVAFVGIGENGHLAFNDPPADFETENPFIVVDLTEKCRQQQVNEGWFETIEQVPEQAITMSIQQIMKSEEIICTVPGKRKAEAVQASFEGEYITPEIPASILKRHESTYVYLDRDSASLLKQR